MVISCGSSQNEACYRLTKKQYDKLAAEFHNGFTAGLINASTQCEINEHPNKNRNRDI